MSHFLSEMSCGEVVAGSLIFPGRAFEFSSPWIFFLPLSPPLFMLLLHPPFAFFATRWRHRTGNRRGRHLLDLFTSMVVLKFWVGTHAVVQLQNLANSHRLHL